MSAMPRRHHTEAQHAHAVQRRSAPAAVPLQRWAHDEEKYEEEHQLAHLRQRRLARRVSGHNTVGAFKSRLAIHSSSPTVLSVLVKHWRTAWERSSSFLRLTSTSSRQPRHVGHEEAVVDAHYPSDQPQASCTRQRLSSAGRQKAHCQAGSGQCRQIPPGDRHGGECAAPHRCVLLLSSHVSRFGSVYFTLKIFSRATWR